eukprot:CAMPEP_0116911830 /NCGR_PEP_ID=MMETSP0467-20121206/15722_1 /TAXON_ID=283647 /ORGANISM="Mesodinium pulex, Strain SPMC105" /LENGTH=67 /DNA_ID=CAMNT_0004587689 /DNA_START=888 /DNA_END=1091 /DNA_ORIENTATION=+
MQMQKQKTPEDLKQLQLSKKALSRPSTANALKFSNEINEIEVMDALQLDINAPFEKFSSVDKLKLME